MLKVTIALKSRDDWTREETVTHYREHHAALVASSSEFTRFVVKYVQNYVVRPEDPVFAGQRQDPVFVSQIWFRSREDFKAAFAVPQIRYIRDDERRFANFEGIIRQYGREVEIFDAETGSDAKAIVRRPRVNLFVVRSRKAGTAQAAFQEYWRGERARALVEDPVFQRYVRRYVQTHALDGKWAVLDAGSDDVIDEFSFATLDDAAAFWDVYRAADEAMVDRETSWFVLAESRVICAELVAWDGEHGQAADAESGSA